MFRVLKLTDEQLTVISRALMLAPYGEVAPVIDAINEQLRQPQPQPRQREAEDSHGPHLHTA